MNALLTPGMLRDYLRQHKRVSLPALAAHFSASTGMIESVLAYWQQRGKIETTDMPAINTDLTNSAPILSVCGKGSCAACSVCPPLQGVAAPSPLIHWKE